VLLRDRLPAYISWERFEANQKRLAANRARTESAGAPRQGAALLGGLLFCGRCGRRMTVRYSGTGQTVWYGCTRGSSSYADPLCQSLTGRCIDELVAGQILAAVQPAALQASLAAVADIQRERADLTKHWQLRIERIRYEAERVFRQYQACEPENRLVARELERRWEEALKQQQQLEQEFACWQRTAPMRLSEQDQAAIKALAEDLPALWKAETTSPADRQRIARLLLKRVEAIVDKESEKVDVKLYWHGGEIRQHSLARPVSRYTQQSDYPRLVERLKELCKSRLSSSQIAERLNLEGFRPPKRTDHFSGEMVRRLTAEMGIQRRQRHGSLAALATDEYRPASLARKLGVKRDTVRRWMRAGWLSTRRDEDNHTIIWADADEVRRLQELHKLPRNWENKRRVEQLKKPKERPQT
jgi:hypothetical protein